MAQKPVRLSLVLGLGLLTGLACRTNGSTNDINQLARSGRYAEALELAEEVALQSPEDQEAQRVYLRAQVAYLLSEGRARVFGSQEEEALEVFNLALELDPDNQAAWMWITKTRLQLAEQWLDKAQELTGPDRLEQSYEAYTTALSYLPDPPVDQYGQGERNAQLLSNTKRGLVRAIVTMNYRAGLSKTYYDQGLEDFDYLLLQSAKRNFGLSQDYSAENELAAEREQQVKDMMAQERLAQAQELERQGLFFAARNEYRLVLLIDPEDATAEDGLNRMDLEVRIARNIEQVEMDILRGESDKAGPMLEASEALTKEQGDDVSRLKAQIEDERLRTMYDDGVNLERDGRFPEAVEAYDRLLEEAGGYYEDAIARKNTLLSFIRAAEAKYAQAAAAATREEEYAYLREILVIWPAYLDVEERVKQYEAELEETETDGDDEEGAPEGGE